MYGMRANDKPSSSFAHQAFNDNIVFEKILSHLGDNPIDLIKYRSVSHRWNNTIVKKINKSGQSLKIPFRYGRTILRGVRMFESDAERFGRRVMVNVKNTLTGTAAKIHFNSVVVDNGFYLAGFMNQWTQILKIQGQFIRHVKFQIRPEEFPGISETHVTDIETLVSMENLQFVFWSCPNLESLDFCIRFSLCGSRPIQPICGRQKMFPDGNVPQLQKLTKITIHEPRGFPYKLEFLKQLLSMAPHLTSFYIKPTSQMLTYCRVIKSLETQFQGSLTCLGLSGEHYLGDSFSYLRLTTLEVNNLSCKSGECEFVDKLLQTHHSTLVRVILGKRGENEDPNQKSPDPDFQTMLFNYAEMSETIFPPVMENLKSLDMDFDQFKLLRLNSYQDQFPVLELLALSINGSHEDVVAAVAGPVFRPRDGRACQTLKEFYFFCPQLGTLGKNLISTSARATFPRAILHI